MLYFKVDNACDNETFYYSFEKFPYKLIYLCS